MQKETSQGHRIRCLVLKDNEMSSYRLKQGQVLKISAADILLGCFPFTLFVLNFTGL